MNILPKKSWHVRTRKNIERVRRDEAEAAENEKALQKRAQLAEFESRVGLLKRRKHGVSEDEQDGGVPVSRDDDSSNDVTSSHQEKECVSIVDARSGHVNFFADAELAEGRLGGATNRDAEAESKAEQEEWEKKVGILTYLGQNAPESSGECSWYMKSHEERNALSSVKRLDGSSETAVVDKKIKDAQDPARLFRKVKQGGTKTTRNKIEFVSATDVNAHNKILPPHSSLSSSSSKSSTSSRHKSHKKHKKRHKQDKVSKKPGTSKKSTKHKYTRHDVESKEQMLEQLRAERLKRETAERLRAQQLMQTLMKPKLDAGATQTVIPDDRRRRYNQQYNPDLCQR